MNTATLDITALYPGREAGPVLTAAQAAAIRAIALARGQGVIPSDDPAEVSAGVWREMNWEPGRDPAPARYWSVLGDPWHAQDRAEAEALGLRAGKEDLIYRSSTRNTVAVCDRDGTVRGFTRTALARAADTGLGDSTKAPAFVETHSVGGALRSTDLPRVIQVLADLDLAGRRWAGWGHSDAAASLATLALQLGAPEWEPWNG